MSGASMYLLRMIHCLNKIKQNSLGWKELLSRKERVAFWLVKRHLCCTRILFQLESKLGEPFRKHSWWVSILSSLGQPHLDSEHRLLKDLFANYSKEVRPVIDKEQPIPVNFDMMFSQLVELVCMAVCGAQLSRLLPCFRPFPLYIISDLTPKHLYPI